MKTLLNLGCGNVFHPDWLNVDLVSNDENVLAVNLREDWPFPQNSADAIYSSHVLEHMPRPFVSTFLRRSHACLRPGGVLRLVVPDLEKTARAYVFWTFVAKWLPQVGEAKHEWMTVEMLDQLTRTQSGGFMGRFWASSPLKARSFIISRLGQEAGYWIELFEKQAAVSGAILRHDQVFEVVDETTVQDEIEFRDQGEIHRWMYDEVSLKKLLKATGFKNVKVQSFKKSRILNFSSYQLDQDEKGKQRKPDSLYIEALK